MQEFELPREVMLEARDRARRMMTEYLSSISINVQIGGGGPYKQLHTPALLVLAMEVTTALVVITDYEEEDAEGTLDDVIKTLVSLLKDVLPMATKHEKARMQAHFAKFKDAEDEGKDPFEIVTDALRAMRNDNT